MVAQSKKAVNRTFECLRCCKIVPDAKKNSEEAASSVGQSRRDTILVTNTPETGLGSPL
jgi:hypothetical protein